jgi:hypothetical protein
LSRQPFFTGTNDPFGGNPSGAAFTPAVFSLFGSWLGLKTNLQENAAKPSIARGEQIFAAFFF